VHFLAFDLGAESGRAVLARFGGGVLDVREVHRFPNEPVRRDGALQWDILRLWLEVQRGLERVSGTRLESVGIDTWGVDFGLIGEQGALLDNPYHYRDGRTDGVMDEVFTRVSREQIYATTGIQFLPINTLYQLYAACRATPRLVAAADTLLTIPDLLNYWLTGERRAEFTNATTTQLVDARTRNWAVSLLGALDLPARLLAPIVEPGAVLGAIRREAGVSATGTPVVVPGCHDTASAVAAVAADGATAFLSSGTWSLLGTEVPAPVLTPKARDLNFTNEGGVCGTTRLLKNIGGLWLLQSCQRSWAAAGHDFAWEDLVAAAAEGAPAFSTLVDPDCPSFLSPEDMVAAIGAYCRRTDQPAPDTPPAIARAILESLAFKYRATLEALEEVTGTRVERIRVVGGGARNRLLNQFTADATGRPVVAGPLEASALGNIAMQMLASGAVASLDEARRVIDRSFPVEHFAPVAADRWDAEYPRFMEYVGLSYA